MVGVDSARLLACLFLVVNEEVKCESVKAITAHLLGSDQAMWIDDDMNSVLRLGVGVFLFTGIHYY